MRPFALAAVLLILVTGCVPTRALPPQPTGDELDELIALELDLQWQFLGLTPDSPRPAVERVRLVSDNEAEAVHKECIIDAGYENYGSSTATAVNASNFERLALYICAAQYPVAPSNLNLFSEEQLSYLYDYFETTVIPCLKAADVAVDDIPTRAEYIDGSRGKLFAWLPYGSLDNTPLDRYVVVEKCPAYPDGFTGY
jgi:hypothetical protein